LTTEKKTRKPLNPLQLLALLGVIGITVLIFALRDQIKELTEWGYLGIFGLSVVSNATVILPAPGIAFTCAFGTIFNPLGIALVSGAGAALGELTGYLAGYSGRGVVERSDLYERLEAWTERYGPWTILVLAMIPNPVFDLAGAAAGALRMKVSTFLLFGFVGKSIKLLAITYACASGAEWLSRFLGI
jgi:membrane protein YqaA with SNARE-associated domain